MIAMTPAPATGAEPDTIATGVNATNNPVLASANSRPPRIRLISAVSISQIAHEDADH